jgi:hypothetical protein
LSGKLFLGYNSVALLIVNFANTFVNCAELIFFLTLTISVFER